MHHFENQLYTAQSEISVCPAAFSFFRSCWVILKQKSHSDLHPSPHPLNPIRSPRLIPKVTCKHTHKRCAFVGLVHSCTKNCCWYTQSGHTTFLRSAICHVEKNLQSSSVCCRLRLKAFLWKFMPKQLWSHPPVCRPWRQRCPRNYERDPIHYTAPEYGYPHVSH